MYVHVKTTNQTAKIWQIGIWCILVKHLQFQWLQLVRDMEQFLQQSEVQYERGELLGSEYLQRVNNVCTTLKYNVFSLSESIQLELYADGRCSIVGDKLTVLLSINMTCPSGFNLSKTKRSCVCEKRIQKYTNQCNITNGLGLITRDSNKHFWIGFNEQYGEVILHPTLPLWLLCQSNCWISSQQHRPPVCTPQVSVEHARKRIGYFSLQTMYQQPFCLDHSFCCDGSSSGLLAFSLQTDSDNRNTQWPSVLCEHRWSESDHHSTSGIY